MIDNNTNPGAGARITDDAARLVPRLDISAVLSDKREETENLRECFTVEGLNLFYNSNIHALKNINLTIPDKCVTAFIGPSGCGKSSLLRCFNRMNDMVDGCRMEGKISLKGQDINASTMDAIALRKAVGMVFQKPNPFPKSIYENVAFGLRLHGMKKKRQLDEVVECALVSAGLWEETKDRLSDNALKLSGGQQQRLVIARSIALQPEVLLLDEPASALDPISTLRIESLIHELKRDYCIVIVTHNMQQAARVSDFTAFMNMGELIEFDSTDIIFTKPSLRATDEYITGRYG